MLTDSTKKAITSIAAAANAQINIHESDRDVRVTFYSDKMQNETFSVFRGRRFGGNKNVTQVGWYSSQSEGMDDINLHEQHCIAAKMVAQLLTNELP